MKCYAVVKLLKYSNIYSMQSFCFLLGLKVSYTTAVQFCAMFFKNLHMICNFFVVLNFNKQAISESQKKFIYQRLLNSNQNQIDRVGYTEAKTSFSTQISKSVQSLKVGRSHLQQRVMAQACWLCEKLFENALRTVTVSKQIMAVLTLCI